MIPKISSLEPNRARYAADPFGYSALAWDRWTLAAKVSGVSDGPQGPPRADDLKTPTLWLAHAHALSEAASTIVRNEPSFDSIPRVIRGICDGQYCAVGLMLVGYSLEVALKAMLLVTMGVAGYSEVEKTFHHHKLTRLAELVPDLSEKDQAILECLTEFVIWAGRYPDPGRNRLEDLEKIFALSEKHQVAGRDLFAVSARVMAHAQVLVERMNSR